MTAAKKYYLVQADVLPEIFLKVMEAKEMLETGEADTVAEAVTQVGISRSAFYKYKDAISNFRDMKQGRIITFQLMLRDRTGVLSSLLTIFSGSGANILTINQSIPTNGAALVTITAEADALSGTAEDLLDRLRDTQGVIRAEILAG